MEDTEVGEDVLEEAEWWLGVLRFRNWPKRFIPLEIKLAKPNLSSRPWKIPSEVGEVTLADLEDGLEGVFLTAEPLLESLSLLKAEGRVL